MLRVALDVPYLYQDRISEWVDFVVAHYEPAMADPEYRRKLTRPALLLCPPLELRELQRAVSLTRPYYVTVHPPTDSARVLEKWLRQASLAVDAELALVAEPGADDRLALAEQNEYVAIVPQVDGRMDWLARSAYRPWVHLDEIASAEELKAAVELAATGWPMSVHTARPALMALDVGRGWEDVQSLPPLPPDQVLEPHQLDRLLTLAKAIYEVTR